MRQRLLLIAGWAVAAFGSSVVASGAVAVAGGQVTDRPLRLLSASEVEAIPIVNTAAGSAISEPPASGGIADSSGAPDEVIDTAAGRADRRSPAGDGGATRGSPPTTGATLSNTAAPDPGAALVDEVDLSALDPTDPASAEPSLAPADIADLAESSFPFVRITASGAHVVNVTGGTAAFGGAEGSVELLWALPRAGYTVELDFVNPEALELFFVGGNDTTTSSIVRAVWSGEGLTIEFPTATTGAAE